MDALRILAADGCYDHRPQPQQPQQPPPPPPTLSCKRRRQEEDDRRRKTRWSTDDQRTTLLLLLDDKRSFRNLLEGDEQHLASPSYFRFQSDLRPYMRKMVVIWMLEVCEEQSSEDETFWLAVNYLDRILSVLTVKKNQLQLIASVCLFIASKFNASSNFITASHLVMYTDFSITVDELLEWELTVLQALKWSVSITTPFDFLRHFVIGLSLDDDQTQSVERHATTLIALSTTDVKFVVYPASMLASGCLCAAVKGLLGAQWMTNTDLYRRIQQYTAVETDCLVECQEQIEELLRRSLEEAAAAAAAATLQQQQQREDSSSSLSIDASKSSASSSSSSSPEEDPSATTPTDVREIVVNCGATTFNSC